LGDEQWGQLNRWHDETLRSVIDRRNGQVVKTIGDGFFAAFENAAEGIRAAIDIQRALQDHRTVYGFAPRVRIGLHVAEATREGSDYRGRGVNEAARIGALAGADEILTSLETVVEAPGQGEVLQRRTVSLKGISRPFEVATLNWRPAVP
ncbi:MAG: adenylate/guanylate cyclase domain-containing protein, partial [Actinomycetota bacterium]